MDETEYQISMINHLEKLINNADSIKKVELATKFVNYYRRDGLNVSKHERRLRSKLNLLLILKYNQN